MDARAHWLLLVAVFIILVASCVSLVYSKDLGKEQAAMLYAIAYGHMGHLPQRAPEVHIVPRERLCELGGLRADCRLSGLEQSGTVYLWEGLDFDAPYDASIALHELVHAVQYDKLGNAVDCEEKVRREREAYTIQIKALSMTGADTRGLFMAMRGLSCL